MPTSYDQLVNKSGTIYNTATGKGYSDPNSLATDLGVSSNAINWKGIKADPNYSFTPAPAATTPPQTFSFMDKSTYDVNQNPTQVSNSSAVVDKAVKNLGGNISKTAGSTLDLQTLMDSFKVDTTQTDTINKLYEDRRTALKKRKTDALVSLDATYNTEKATKEADYQKNIDPLKKRQELLNSTPYGTNATLEQELKLKLNDLEQTHKLEMDTLFNQRQSLVSQAQASFEDNDFKLAESQMKNAKDTQAEIYKRQQDFFDTALKLQQEQRAQQKVELDSQQASMEQAKEMRTFIQKNATGTKPYVLFGGTIFDVTSGQQIDPVAFQQSGLDFNDAVESIQDQSAFETSDTRNWNFYAKQMQDKGLKPLDFGTWSLQQKKAGASTTYINPNDTKSINNVQAILDAHPNDWGGAADAIDKQNGTFIAGSNGQNTYPVEKRVSTSYDSLLKEKYALPADAQNFGTYVSQQINSGQKWDQKAYDAGYELFKQKTPYLIDDIKRKAIYDKAVPQPGSSKGFQLDPAALNAAIKKANE